VAGVVLVCHPQRVDEYRAACGVGLTTSKVAAVVPGGETRTDSVRAGLGAVPPEAAVIMTHDGARPLVTPAVIEEAVAALTADAGIAGVVVGHPMYDTVKVVAGCGEVTATADRSTLWAAQTPQVFRAGPLRAALDAAAGSAMVATDDSALVEQAGYRVRMVEGPRDNIKVTVPEDLAVVEALLAARGRDVVEG